MKIKKSVLVSCFVISMGLLYGCGVNSPNNTNITTEESNQQEINKEEVNSNKEQGKLLSVGEGEDKLNSEETTIKDVPMVQLPEGIEGMKAEGEAYPDLESLIINYYDIPEEYLGETTYYYNYVDLNNDGKNEMFVVIIGPYTSGTGGSSALWVIENGGQLHVNQDFTLVNNPVIISDKITNGYHELVIPYSGGGAKSQYKILKSKDEFYTTINDSDSVEALDGITGKAIIANDIFNENENGIEALRLK